MCCKKYFYDKFIEVINQWKEDEIAAISILVYSNETYVYKGIKIRLHTMRIIISYPKFMMSEEKGGFYGWIRY